MNLFRRTTAACLLIPILVVGTFYLAACSDSTTPDHQNPRIIGSVTGSGGDAVPGASILVSFRPSFEDVLQPEKGQPAPSDLPPPGPIYWIKITNACGDTIRTLCQEGCNDIGGIYWDGLDDAGLRAVEGVYTFILAMPEDYSISDFVLIHYYTDWNTEDCQTHCSSGAEGQFELSDRCLGFGKSITVMDEEGNMVDERPISRLVNLRVVSPAGQIALRDSVWFPTSGNLVVDFVLPN